MEIKMKTTLFISALMLASQSFADGVSCYVSGKEAIRVEHYNYRTYTVEILSAQVKLDIKDQLNNYDKTNSGNGDVGTLHLREMSKSNLMYMTVGSNLEVMSISDRRHADKHSYISLTKKFGKALHYEFYTSKVSANAAPISRAADWYFEDCRFW